LQSERTRLSWTRTALALAGVGALLAHAGRSIDGATTEWPGLVVLLMAAVEYGAGHRRYRWRRQCTNNEQTLAAPCSLLAMSVAATITAILGGALLVLSWFT
jgi:uncharacterized membrane protein YidH (DUF202 family)